MKKIKIIYALSFCTAGLLWSCQTEAYVETESQSKSKVVADGGLPSPNDDQYQFDKTKYYYGSQLVSDTLQIKNLMAKAKSIHIDENGKTDIYITETETKAFEAEMTKSEVESKNNQSPEGRAALSGDKFLTYFYEASRYPNNSTEVFSDYTQLVGPVLNYDQTYIYYTEFKRDNAVANNTPRFVNRYSGSLAHYFVSNSNLSTSRFYFQINVLNVTRYKRRLVIVSKDLVGGIMKVYKDLSPNKSWVFSGKFNSDPNGGIAFNGLPHFWVDFHNSWKI